MGNANQGDYNTHERHPQLYKEAKKYVFHRAPKQYTFEFIEDAENSNERESKSLDINSHEDIDIRSLSGPEFTREGRVLESEAETNILDVLETTTTVKEDEEPLTTTVQTLNDDSQVPFTTTEQPILEEDEIPPTTLVPTLNINDQIPFDTTQQPKAPKVEDLPTTPISILSGDDQLSFTTTEPQTVEETESFVTTTLSPILDNDDPISLTTTRTTNIADGVTFKAFEPFPLTQDLNDSATEQIFTSSNDTFRVTPTEVPRYKRRPQISVGYSWYREG